MQSVDLRSVRPTLADLAHRHILDALMSHQLQPGDRLRPDDLAATMGISQTPVKEALARLAGEGLVDLSRATGPRVALLPHDGLAALYDCRVMCELHALGESAELIRPEFLTEAARLLENYDSALAEGAVSFENRKRVDELDGAFHQHLVSLRPNSRLSTWYAQLDLQLRGHRLSVAVDDRDAQHRNETFRSQHRAIYAALERRDAAAAVAAARAHVEFDRDCLLGVLNAGLR
jgi:DNA-binding GntR family transcriptional regulator